MAQLMDLKIDFAFKQIFGTVGNEPILIAFLNAALKLPPEEQIDFVEIVNPELPREQLEDKASVLDILARTRDNVQINIEIQLANQLDMKKRTLYYWARVYERQLNKGESYSELAQTITINILNFRLLQETDRFHTTFHLYEDEEQFPLTDVMEIHFMEIPKLMVKWKQGTVNPQQDALVRWLLLLEADDHLEIRKELEAIAMEDPVIQRAFEVWEELSRDDKKWWEYESRFKAMADSWDREYRQKMHLQKALEEGLEKGREAGLEEGQEIAKEAIARKLLSRGMTVDEVVELSGLPLKRVEQLREQL